MHRLLAIAFGAILLMGALAGIFSATIRAAGQGGNDAPAAAAGAAGARPAADPDTLVLQRDETGQFHLSATIRGEDVRFLVDTGADVVALTEDTAERLGLLPPADDFRPIMQTASGTGNGAPVVIDALQLDDSEFLNVEAVVVEGLRTNLLGQSVLRRLGKVELQGDVMVIRHD